MPVDLSCPHCKQPFRPPAPHAGKTTACPHCGEEVRIPTADTRRPPTAETEHPRKTPATLWYVQAEDGRQYGPVSGDRLHAWYKEGRITADCQLLRKGAAQWEWATDIYPDAPETPARQAVASSEVKPAPLQPAPRAAPAQSATEFAPLDPSDFPAVGAGLTALGPMVRELPPNFRDPQYHEPDAIEDRRKYAPHMVARIERPPLHRMLILIAVLNFLVGTLRGGFYAFTLVTSLIAVGAVGEDGNRQTIEATSVATVLSFVLLCLAITLISGGIGLLQQREWGRTATFIGTVVNLIIQLIFICVSVMLGAGASIAGRSMLLVYLIVILPSLLYDVFAAATLIVPSVIAHLED